MLITGGAGFIGSNLCISLIRDKPIPFDEIVVIDNLSLGKKDFVYHLIDAGKVVFYEEDLLNFENIMGIFEKHGFDLVWHLAANSDISYGTKHSDWDLKQGVLVTYNVLESMRRTGAKKIIFSSSSAIYGEANTKPTPENYGPLFPISLYGASKLAAEGLISSFCNNFGFKAWIYRFANIVGGNATHGVIIDFINKLKRDKTKLEILGDGKQSKPYLHVQDCINGMLFGLLNATDKLNFFNLTCEGVTSVYEIYKMVTKELQLDDVTIKYKGGDRGWSGDVAKVNLDNKKLAKLGWKSSCASNEAVAKAVTQLLYK